MNLDAKEFCAARIDNQGVLILSEFTGSAQELSGALMINPFSVDRIADAMLEVIAMEPQEEARRMRAMRNTISHQNIWAPRKIDKMLDCGTI
jgi:trehalose-6-phosphate synthase